MGVFAVFSTIHDPRSILNWFASVACLGAGVFFLVAGLARLARRSN